MEKGLGDEPALAVPPGRPKGLHRSRGGGNAAELESPLLMEKGLGG